VSADPPSPPSDGREGHRERRGFCSGEAIANLGQPLVDGTPHPHPGPLPRRERENGIPAFVRTGRGSLRKTCGESPSPSGKGMGWGEGEHVLISHDFRVLQSAPGFNDIPQNELIRGFSRLPGCAKADGEGESRVFCPFFMRFGPKGVCYLQNSHCYFENSRCYRRDSNRYRLDSNDYRLNSSCYRFDSHSYHRDSSCSRLNSERYRGDSIRSGRCSSDYFCGSNSYRGDSVCHRRCSHRYAGECSGSGGCSGGSLG
jgi:hypothetical protein